MREIKFRVWLPKLEKMTVPFALEDSNVVMPEYIPSQCIIMQYTGLKDRGGVDIFEGDILKCDFSRDNNGLHDSVQVVEFYEGSFGSRNKNDHFRIPALFSGRATEGMNLNYYEVIGNVHQHPELCSA